MTVKMKKPHPCGGNTFRILRTGTDVRCVCETCGRELFLPRVKFEKAMKPLPKETGETGQTGETGKEETPSRDT